MNYLITRPRLATIMKENNIPCTQVPNPFAADRMVRFAWEVELNDKAAHLIQDFYTSIGKPTPYRLQKYFDEGGARV